MMKVAILFESPKSQIPSVFLPSLPLPLPLPLAIDSLPHRVLICRKRKKSEMNFGVVNAVQNKAAVAVTTIRIVLANFFCDWFVNRHF